MKVNSYLVFNGQAKEAIKFYESVFNSKAKITTFGEENFTDNMPPLTEEQKKLVLHGELPIGESSIYFSDNMPGEEYIDNFSYKISLSVAFVTVKEAKEIFERLGKNGEIIMPIEKSPWSEGFGMLIDKYGIAWQINAD